MTKPPRDPKRASSYGPEMNPQVGMPLIFIFSLILNNFVAPHRVFVPFKEIVGEFKY